MKVPSLHIIYSSLKDHHRISRLQASATMWCYDIIYWSHDLLFINFPVVVLLLLLMFQKNEVDRIVQSMKVMKMIPHSWQPEALMSRSPVSKTSPGSHPQNDERGMGSSRRTSQSRRAIEGKRDKVESKLDRSHVVPDDKMEKLKDYFKNVRLTPVKKVATGKCLILIAVARRITHKCLFDTGSLCSSA